MRINRLGFPKGNHLLDGSAWGRLILWHSKAIIPQRVLEETTDGFAPLYRGHSISHFLLSTSKLNTTQNTRRSCTLVLASCFPKWPAFGVGSGAAMVFETFSQLLIANPPPPASCAPKSVTPWVNPRTSSQKGIPWYRKCPRFQALLGHYLSLCDPSLSLSLSAVRPETHGNGSNVCEHGASPLCGHKALEVNKQPSWLVSRHPRPCVGIC